MTIAIEEFLDAFREYSTFAAQQHLASLDKDVRENLLLNLIHYANAQRDKLTGAKELAAQINKI